MLTDTPVLPEPRSLRERDWDTLLWSLQQRNCILLLGPELVSEGDGQEATLTGDLARHLTADLSPQYSHLREFPRVAQQYAAEIGRNDLEREVVRFYRSHQADTSSIHEALAALPFYFVITSCHDSLLQKAMRSQEKTPLVERYHFKGENKELVPTGSVKSPLIYHLYGMPEEPQSLVLSENDLLDFLVAVISKSPRLPNNVSSELQKSGKSFLFLGFGIKHWYLRILLHVLRFNRSDRSFALETLQSVKVPDFEQTILFYKMGYKIEVFESEIATFTTELRQRYQAASGGPEGSPVGLAGGAAEAAKVFICYASEDRPAAQSLYAALKKEGLDPWMDTEGLTGGDQWDPLIEKKVKEVDYFLILQSEALARKIFGYVNKEINLALGRQQFARHGTRFVIPLQVEDDPMIPELEHLQAHPLADVKGLISLIRRDYQRRARP